MIKFAHIFWWSHNNGKQSASAREHWCDVSCDIPYCNYMLISNCFQWGVRCCRCWCTWGPPWMCRTGLARPPYIWPQKGRQKLYGFSWRPGQMWTYRTMQVILINILIVSDRFGQTPLHLAAERSSETVRILLEAGANVDIQDNAGNTYKHPDCIWQILFSPHI